MPQASAVQQSTAAAIPTPSHAGMSSRETRRSMNPVRISTTTSPIAAA